MIHVCFGLYDKTGCYSKFTGTAMLSIFEHTKSEITVHILHDNTLTQDNRDKFSAVANQYNQRVEFYNVEVLCADKIAEYMNLIPNVKNHYLSVAALYRLLVSQLLAPDIDKVIYLDSDIIVNLDIAELWQFDLGDKILGVVPEILNRNNVHDSFALCRDGLVKDEDYFNSGVLLMNLTALRGEKNILPTWSKIIEKNLDYAGLLDQDALNYCFSTRTVKLPLKFNRFVLWARATRELNVTEKIYHYAGGGLGTDTDDPFNRLWLEYFAKTPWFTAETIDRLCVGFRQTYIELSVAMVKLTATMSGKTRVFVVNKSDIDKIKKSFAVRADEEIITVDKYIPLQEIFEEMNSSRGKKICFTFIPDFPFENFKRLGFVYGQDFLNGLGFLPKRRFLMDTYKLIQAM